MRQRHPAAPVRTRAARTAIVVLAAGALAACTGASDGPATTNSTTATGTTSAEPTLAPSRFPSLAATSKSPIGSTTGRIEGVSPSTAVTISVLSVVATEQSTILSYTVSAQAEARVTGDYPLASARSGIELVDTAGEVRLLPESFTSGAIERTCVCSSTPTRIGPQPVYQYMAYPPLPTATTSVDVKVPGLRAISAPVVRR